MKSVLHIAVAVVTAITTAMIASPPTVQASGFVSAAIPDAEQVAVDHLERTIDPPPAGWAVEGLDGNEFVLASSSRELRVTATASSAASDITHVYVQQTQGGLDIIGADANVAVQGRNVV